MVACVCLDYYLPRTVGLVAIVVVVHRGGILFYPLPAGAHHHGRRSWFAVSE
jgi:hypothetical protein